MGQLVVGSVEFNDATVFDAFSKAVQATLERTGAYFPLEFKPGFYLSAAPGVTLPREPGWYVILEHQTPIYVGQAEDLNARLNSNQGSLDNFAKRDRVSDPERNFIKKFRELGRLPGLRVCLITQADLASALSVSGSAFSKVDVDNVEKTLNVLRGMFRYL